MANLPVIVGFGGINAAGRSSSHHGYRRLVIDELGGQAADETYRNLASLMNVVPEMAANSTVSAEIRQHINENTLIRRIHESHFDVDHVPWNKRLTMHSPEGENSSFVAIAKQLPEHLPENWQVNELPDGLVRIDVTGKAHFMVPTQREFDVKAAGQLPTGFDPRLLYQSRNHPRGLQMTVFGASDALGSMGIDWQQVTQLVSPDQISVYAGSGMSQLDANGNGGMVMARANGKKVTSKQCPLGFAEMPADFINAYVLGTFGTTGTSMGACASFLYNLRMGINDIQSGRSRVAIVGNSEAPITPEVMEGYAAMGALATDKGLMALDGGDVADHRRACRPFSDNCGFTIAEAAQFVVLFDDSLAMELGASIYGAVGDVSVNADGHKKSISAPGAGNYLTLARALASARAVLGSESLQKRSFIQAHGTGTPQNRVTESHVINEVAKAFGISNWPVAAIKAYLGHSIGVAGGDQIINSLGVWQYGIIPGIATIDHVASDVHQSNLSIQKAHRHLDSTTDIDVAIVNAKGFGGNNATASVFAPHIVEKMLKHKYGQDKFTEYQKRNESVAAAATDYDVRATQGTAELIYKFDHNVLSGEDFDISDASIGVPGYSLPVDLDVESPYKDFLE